MTKERTTSMDDTLVRILEPLEDEPLDLYVERVSDAVRAQIEAERREERERCAQIARDSSEYINFRASDGHVSIRAHGVDMRDWIAARILDQK